MIETVQFNNKNYPAFQAQGNSAQYIIPFAKQVCKGTGYDIGCKKIEWSLPGSIPIDLSFNDKWSALNLPTNRKVDYIFSSHCLEHIESGWFNTLSYWAAKLNSGGVLFLYLPDYSQEYWRPWNNKKHFHVFTPEIIRDAFIELNLLNIYVSGIDLNNSFAAMGEKI